MAFKAIEWEGLSAEERLALAAAGNTGPLAFTALWYNVTQIDSFQPNWHHHYFDWAARRLLSGDIKTLVINIPPGGTKTEFWSIHFPVFCMTQFPRVRILNTSYSKDLANENSERARALVRSSEFREFFPMDLGRDKIDGWTVERKGKRLHQIFSRSSGGQITGVRGGYMSKGFSGYVAADDWDKIDDLLSETKRKRSHMRLINVVRSRRAHSNTPFVFIQQRGHVEDSTHFLLSGGMGVEVDCHIVIPAMIDEEYIDSLPNGIRERCIQDVRGSEQVDGKWSYWPSKDSVHDLIALQKANPYTFSSQYQQSPESLDGGIFSADDFLYFGDDDGADLPDPPKFEYRFITADTAQKKNTWNDWTVFSEWGFYDGRIYRLSMLRARFDAKELRREFESFAKAVHAKNSGTQGNLRAIMVEDKSSGTGLIQELQSRLPVRVTPVQRDTDKLTRAMDCQPHQASGRVALPYGDPNNFEFVSEVAGFTADDSHRHDDQTDVMLDAIDYVFVQPHKNPKRKAGVIGRR